MGRRPYQLTIDTFTTAVGAAFGLRDRFTHGHGAAVLDGRGRVLDLTVFAADHHSVDTALGWADCAVRNDARARRLVLLSAVTESVAGELREADLDTLRRARQAFAGPDLPEEVLGGVAEEVAGAVLHLPAVDLGHHLEALAPEFGVTLHAGGPSLAP